MLVADPMQMCAVAVQRQLVFRPSPTRPLTADRARGHPRCAPEPRAVAVYPRTKDSLHIREDVPDPLADETASDARELARERATGNVSRARRS